MPAGRPDGRTGRKYADEPLTTASGGSFVKGEISRNEQSPQCGVAMIEAAVACWTLYEGR